MWRLISALVLLAATSLGQTDWRRATAESVGLDTSRLTAMEAAIKAGESKKIGSVLIARHGQLVYEKYFEGDATTLRDTRPASKSITSLLVGLAIQDKKLSGIDAKFSLCRRSTETNCRTPTRAKKRLRSKTC